MSRSWKIAWAPKGRPLLPEIGLRTAEIRHLAFALALSMILLLRPLQGETPGPEWVGDEICGSCHAKIFESYRQSAMGNSLTIVFPQLPEVGDLEGPVTFQDPVLGRIFTISREGGKLYHSQSRLNSRGKRSM